MLEVIAANALFMLMALVLSAGLAMILALLTRDVLRNASGSSLILLIGLFLLFGGERVIAEDGLRLAVSGLGVLVLVLGLGLRALASSRSTGERQAAHRQALKYNGWVLVGLLLYAGTLETATNALGFGEEALQRWSVVLKSLSPICIVLGMLPSLAIDRVLAVHPRAIPSLAVPRAVKSGLSAALVIALLFPVNYLGRQHDITKDVAYFRTTQAGTSTLNIARTLAEPVKVTLFYPAGNDTRAEIEPYFADLEAASSGQLTVQVLDQALDPVLSEEMGVRDNGYVAFTQGEHTEKFKLNADIEKAKRDLKKLDQTVRKHLVKLTRGQRVIYWLVGHGEASPKEKEDDLRKLTLLKRGIFDVENLKVEDFGFATGSTDGVPEDAALVVIAAPQKELLPEETKALSDYLDNGGRMMVLVEADGDPMTPLLTHLGVQVGEGVLAHESKHLARYGGKRDRSLTATNKFGSHESVKTLARNAAQLGLVIPTSRWVAKTEDTKNRVSTLVRSFPDTWADLDGGLDHDAETEEKKVFEMAVAVSGTDDNEEMRAVVVGDVNLLSDPLLQAAQGNQVFARDTLLWLLDDGDIAGEIESEEDVQIVHTRDEDFAWFWMTVLGVPVLLLGLGIVSIRLRGRNR